MFAYSLFAEPNFISGMSRVLDMGLTLNEFNYTRTPDEADKVAIFSDWLAVGADIFQAMENYKKNANKENRKT